MQLFYCKIPDLPGQRQFIQKLLSEHAVDPRRLFVELTETAAAFPWTGLRRFPFPAFCKHPEKYPEDEYQERQQFFERIHSIYLVIPAEPAFIMQAPRVPSGTPVPMSPALIRDTARYGETVPCDWREDYPFLPGLIGLSLPPSDSRIRVSALIFFIL